MIYTAKCSICGIEQNYVRSVQDRHKCPQHCGKKMQKIIVPYHIAPLFQEYIAVGIPGKPLIKSRQEHKDTLRQHGKIEVGNDASVAPPKMERGEFEYNQKQQLDEIMRDREQIDKISHQLGID